MLNGHTDYMVIIIKLLRFLKNHNAKFEIVRAILTYLN